ncbi:hypothetical protein BD414DRAFT_464286 [Trametes punicea]|nr:hypothetical protein BD414DRAFT_464286 [Trametes punicea]
MGDVTPWPTTIQIDSLKETKPLGRPLTSIHNDNLKAENKGKGYKWCDNWICFRNITPAHHMAQCDDPTECDASLFEKYVVIDNPATERIMGDLVEKCNAPQVHTPPFRLLINRIEC